MGRSAITTWVSKLAICAVCVLLLGGCSELGRYVGSEIVGASGVLEPIFGFIDHRASRAPPGFTPGGSYEECLAALNASREFAYYSCIPDPK